MAQYFYDGQLRRFILQFIRYFSGFQVEYGKDANGNPIYLTVPVRYADNNRVGSAILKNNSENSVQNVPMMVVYIDNLKYHRSHIQSPTYTEKRNIRERAYDADTGELKTYQQNAVTIERHMPVPYRMDLKLDIYTSNIEQKLQLWEQIAVMFNPAMEIQSTDNYLDWTSLSWILLTDTNFSSRTIPVGTDDPIDVATMAFEIPVYITPPAKITKLNAVQSVVASMYDNAGNLSEGIQTQLDLIGNRQWFTPTGYNAVVANGQVILSQHTAYGTDGNLVVPVPFNDPVNWRGVINYLGELTNGVSMMAFINETTGNTVIGTLSYHPTDDTILLFNVDEATIPTNTLTAIDRVVDPRNAAPGYGLVAAATGQRYLLINNDLSVANDPANNPLAWRNSDNSVTAAVANDIIQYDGSRWNVIFNSRTTTTQEYLTNVYTGIQYKWLNKTWQKSWEGLYKEGLWQLII
jgi:hypothetical protein